jgi:hypothetical protein
MFIFNPVKPNCMNNRRTTFLHEHFQGQNKTLVLSSQMGMEKTLFSDFERKINAIEF